MARPKMSLEKRLNFWVSEETYDFYAKLAIRRKQKISELLRMVLDKATALFEDGELRDALPMTKESLHELVRELAAEEVAKVIKPSGGAIQDTENPFVAEARKAAENTENRGKDKEEKTGAAKGDETESKKKPGTGGATRKRRRIIEMD